MDISGKHPSHWFSFDIFYSLAAPIKRRGKKKGGKRSSYTIKMKSWTRRLIQVCGLHVCVKCVDVVGHSGAAGYGSPREAHEGKQSTQCQLLADPN